jgi:hypothetical protein
MNTNDTGSKPAVSEFLSADRFQEALRGVARYRSSIPVGDPLDVAVRKITANPAFTQSRLLARMLVALTYQEGEFRRAELAAFDSDTLAMVITLMDVHAAGTTSRERWVRATDAAKAALISA